MKAIINTIPPVFIDSVTTPVADAIRQVTSTGRGANVTVSVRVDSLIDPTDATKAKLKNFFAVINKAWTSIQYITGCATAVQNPWTTATFAASGIVSNDENDALVEGAMTVKIAPIEGQEGLWATFLVLSVPAKVAVSLAYRLANAAEWAETYGNLIRLSTAARFKRSTVDDIMVYVRPSVTAGRTAPALHTESADDDNDGNDEDGEPLFSEPPFDRVRSTAP